MAGDWIKMRHSLKSDPRVVRIMSACDADRFRTLGGLFAAWCLFDEQTTDGFLAGYTAAVFDEIVGFPGLCAAMISVGWIEESPQGLTAVRFDEHNGRTAKRRSQDNVRKMSARHADKCPQPKRTETRRNREEKRREDKGETPLPPLLDTEQFRAAWDAWQQHRREKRSKLTPTAIRQQIAKLAEMGTERAVAAIQHSIANGYTGIFEPDARGSPPPTKPSTEQTRAEARRIYEAMQDDH